MRKRLFGKTGVEVSEIGHGTWTMGSHWGLRDDAAALDSLKLAIQSGVSFIDTAAVYGNGHSERLIGQTLKNISAEIFVATKVPPKNYQWPARDNVAVQEAFPADHIIFETERSLKNLGKDCVDLQQLHVWHDNWLGHGDWPEAISKLKADGKIRFFGISINDHAPQTALKMVESGIVDSVQVIYNIFDQSPADALFPLCQRKNVAVIVRVPFDEGSLTGFLKPNHKFHPKDWRRVYFTPERLPETIARVEQIKKLLEEHGRTLADTALRFCLAHPAVSTVIPGMRTTAHVSENISASDGLPLPSDLLDKLKSQKWLRNFYPSYG